MGNASSAQSSVNNILATSLQLINKNVQDCAPGVSGTTIMRVLQQNDCPNAVNNITISNVSSLQTYALVTEQCVQNISTNTTLQQNIQNSINSVVKELGSKISLSYSDAVAITNLTQNFSTSIINAYTQKCNPTSSSVENITIYQDVGTQQLSCVDGAGTNNVKINAIGYNEIATMGVSCMQSIDNINSVILKINTIIQNSAIAAVSNIWGPILLFFIIGLVLIFGLIFFGGSMFTLTFWIMVAVFSAILSVVWFGFAYMNNWWPFRKPGAKITSTTMGAYIKSVLGGAPRNPVFDNAQLIAATSSSPLVTVGNFITTLTNNNLTADNIDMSATGMINTYPSLQSAYATYVSSTVSPCFFASCSDGTNPVSGSISVLNVQLPACSTNKPVIIDVNHTLLFSALQQELLNVQ
jgi:hypothetical protein